MVLCLNNSVMNLVLEAMDTISLKVIKREPLVTNNGNVKEEFISKKERQKLERVSNTFVHAEWTIEDFSSKFKLKNEGVDPQKEILVVSHDDLVVMFGQRNQNGWKLRMTKDVTTQECFALLKLYEKVYAHPPTNSDYSGILLWGWLVERKDTHVN